MMYALLIPVDGGRWEVLSLSSLGLPLLSHDPASFKDRAKDITGARVCPVWLVSGMTAAALIAPKEG